MPSMPGMRAAPGPRFQAQLTTVGFSESPGDGQSQAGAAVAAGHVGLEERFGVLARAVAAVEDLDLDT